MVTRRGIFYRELAEEDLANAVRHYVDEAGTRIANDFVDEVQKLEESILSFPALGTIAFSHLLPSVALRMRGVEGFPYCVFYIETDQGIDVIRVLHHRQDIPSHLRGS